MNNIYKNFIQILVITIVVLLFMKICQCVYEPFSGSIKAPTPEIKSGIKAPVPAIKSETPPTAPTVSTNNYNVNNLTVTGQLNLFPSGMITAFAGSSVPAGWTLCDGTNGTPDLTGKFVVGAGRGMKDPSNWGIIEQLSTKIGAALACSKPISDLNWRPHHEHVGQTGIKIAPKLYIACGISGAIQHLAGVNGSETIIVINSDPEAPFVKNADYAIIGDLFQVVPELLKNIK